LTVLTEIEGSVINMASNVALMGVTGLDCYTAAKGGIVAITRSMAVEFAPHKARVNAIAPAATNMRWIAG
jgi:NAD(P)-dependent dehydrogenase (short-subunit alcohol dehydrogenase family)